ncbi:uncharacterized protein LOC6560261 [Drosophila grimshawi]|uniref:GH21945 n=1 Tax=Drosophila grimshawi TaxID=7222 RepID=B4J8Q9_DROGR|nr:uncharacterized protein LOC6560261 [Drosophila grimshawi]EDW02349.1 GH21945 [Drosophila grimshawi]
MHVTEFLNRTNRRNRNYQIDCKVQQRLINYAKDLEQRRCQLAHQLHSEERMLDVEMAQLLQARVDAVQNERIEWIQMSLMNSEQAEHDLIKLKQLQREIESSEEYRHAETKHILLDTKRAQLFQIEERKQLRRSQKLTKY